MICTGCGEDCHLVEADFGIGRYEYWGATGYDSRKVVVSHCCEAEWIDDDNGIQEPDEHITELDMETHP